MADQIKGTAINTERISNVEKCFGSSGQKLQNCERILLAEGLVMKMCRKGPKPRKLFLFNDLLVYGTISNKKRYKNQRIIPLEQVEVEDFKDIKDETYPCSKSGFVIKSPSKSFVAYAENEREKNDWIRYISHSIKKLSKNQSQSKQPKAAIWMPDINAPKCMCCESTTFNAIIRRHHCRNCGQVICSKCSTRSLVLKFISDNKPVRVCDICWFQNKLSQVAKEKEQPEPNIISFGDENPQSEYANIDRNSEEENFKVYIS